MNEFYKSSIKSSIYVKVTRSFITGLIYFTFNVKIHSSRTIDRNADLDVKLNYDVMSYEVQTSDTSL